MISYSLLGETAVLAFDDGKRNVVNPAFADAMNAALDRAEKEDAKAIVLKGRRGTFSAGFDLKEFQKGPEASLAQVRAGFRLLVRLFGYPRPVIAACEGHGIGMGIFLILCCDYRVGAHGDFKFSMPESRIGLDLADILVALAKSRISPKYLTRVAVLSEDMDPETAREAGVFDELTEAESVETRALTVAESMASMPAKFGPNKLIVRETELKVMQDFLINYTG